MELLNLNNSQIIDDEMVIKNKNPFIEANTTQVSLDHLKNDCIIPVFSKDNESTISHYQFIKKTMEVAQDMFPESKLKQPDIRVSHVIKGRIPSAIGKPVKELQEHEKTIYYERCMFVIDIPDMNQNINGNNLCLSIGGVRSLSQENLYSKKSLEKFKVFIGYQNRVCTNLCVSTDGLMNDIRISSVIDLEEQVYQLTSQWDKEELIYNMKYMADYFLNEAQFAHIIGKARMYQYLTKQEQKELYPLALNDTQINLVVKDYYSCPNFSRLDNGDISLWNFYNLLTGANKSSYIDSFLERGVSAYGFTQELVKSLENNNPNWFLNN